jgi:hypothetical protein
MCAANNPIQLPTRWQMTGDEEQRLMRVLGGTAAGLFEHAGALMQVIAGFNEETQAEAFGLALERFCHPDYRNGIEVDGPAVTKRRLEELRQSLGGMVDGLLRYIVSNRMTAQVAGKELHRMVMGRPSDEERSFCLRHVLADKCVPYAPMPQANTTISSDRWRSLQNELVTDLARLRTIHSFAGNVTVLADLVLSVMDGTDDREKKVALLAYAFADIFERQERLVALLRQTGVAI